MSNFKVWIDNPIIGTNTFDSNDFANTSLSRGVGFVAGTAASSKWVNSALRQANLVAAAFMDALGSNADGLDLNSSVELVKTRIQNYLNSLSNVAFTQANTRSNLTSGDSLSTQLGKISKWFADLKDMAFLTSVGTSKIDNGAVTTAKIADNSIINSKIATNTIDKSKLTTGIINDYDTSKGTIEQRLTNLGFKESSISLSSGFAAVQNSVTRQGNYVIGFAQVYGGKLADVKVSDAHWAHTDVVIGTLSNEFRPKTEQMFNCSVETDVLSTSESFIQIYTFSRIIISTNGTITLRMYYRSYTGTGQVIFQTRVASSAPTPSDSTGSNVIQLNFGYEANPL